MNPLLPELGLVLWMSIAFLIVLFLLKKFAWSDIVDALHDREEFIERSLKSAEEAKAQLSTLKAENAKCDYRIEFIVRFIGCNCCFRK